MYCSYAEDYSNVSAFNTPNDKLNIKIKDGGIRPDILFCNYEIKCTRETCYRCDYFIPMICAYDEKRHKDKIKKEVDDEYRDLDKEQLIDELKRLKKLYEKILGNGGIGMSMSEPFVTKEQITANQIVDLFEKNNIDWDNLPDRNSDEWKQLYNSFCEILNISEEVFEFYITTVQIAILQEKELLNICVKMSNK